jgi:hypothetical protein
MPQVEEIVSAVDEVDVAIVAISPARRPRVSEGEIVSTVGEAALAADYRHVANCEMVIVTETLVKVLIGDATVLVSFPVLVVPLFLSSVPVFLPVLLLSQRRECSREKE